MKTYIIVAVLLLGCVAFLSFNLGDLSFLKGDENYYFSSSRRMIREGDWITPRYHHHIRFEKPILYYWIVALFFKIFGASWAAARISSVVFGSLTVLLTYLLGLRFLTKSAALLSAVILASAFIFFQYSRLVVADITFLFFITLSLFLFVKGDKEGKRTYFILSFVPLGLSVLTKGPLGLAIVALIILTYIILTKKYNLLKDMKLPLGLILLFIIILPWPLLMVKMHGQEYLNHIWEVETVDKAMGSIFKIKEVDNLTLFAIKYLGYYIPVVIFSFVPWGLFLPFGLFRKINTNKDEGRIFLLSWFWAVFLFFTVVSFKHTHYMLLLSPPLAMIVADFFSDKKIAIIVATITIMVYLSLIGFILPAMDDGVLKDFSLVLSSKIIEQDEEVGIASEGFNLKKLGVHLNNLVSTPYELSGDDLTQYRLIKKDELIPFLESKKRVFCLIKKKDFIAFLPTELQNRLYILEKSFMWKELDLKESLTPMLNMDLESLKEEVYLISNWRQ